MSCGSLNGKRVWGRMDTCMCTAESLCCPPETITILLIDYTPIQTKKLKKKNTRITNEPQRLEGTRKDPPLELSERTWPC